MSLHRLAARRDANEGPIVQALRDLGCKVIPLSHRELADLIVAYRGMTLHVGVKAPDGPRGGTSHGRHRQSGDQRPDDWNGGPWAICTTPSEAVAFVLAATRTNAVASRGKPAASGPTAGPEASGNHRPCPRCINIPPTPEG